MTSPVIFSKQDLRLVKNIKFLKPHLHWENYQTTLYHKVFV